jgi:tetratricopeptide (TPR) repeat protein
MTTQEDVQESWGGPAGRQLHDKAYFLDLLGDSHTGLGRHEAAIEAYRQAAEEFKSEGAHCSYALCLFKVAGSHLSLGEPWHALGYLQACLPLLHELGLTRHETLAREQLAHCQSALAGARLLTGGASRNSVAVYPRQG